MRRFACVGVLALSLLTSGAAADTAGKLAEIQLALDRLDEAAPGDLSPDELDSMYSSLTSAAEAIAADSQASGFTRLRAEGLLLQASTRLLHRHAEPQYAAALVSGAQTIVAAALGDPDEQIRGAAMARYETLNRKANEFSNERSGFHLDRSEPAAPFVFSFGGMVPVCSSDDP